MRYLNDLLFGLRYNLQWRIIKREAKVFTEWELREMAKDVYRGAFAFAALVTIPAIWIVAMSNRLIFSAFRFARKPENRAKLEARIAAAHEERK